MPAPYFHVYLSEFRAVSTTFAVEITAIPVHDAAEIEAAIARLGRTPDGGLIVAPDPFTVVNRHVIIRSAEELLSAGDERLRLPPVRSRQVVISA